MVIIDKHSHTPAYRQLFLALRSDIESGVYRPGTKLPALRTLARDLGYELDDVAQMNVDKLRSRMQRNHLTGSGDNR